MGKLEAAMNMALEVFETYSTIDDYRLHLTKREVKMLLSKELHELLQAVRGTEMVAEILEDLDKNTEDLVDFPEFACMVAKLVMCSQPYFALEGPVTPTKAHILYC